MVPNKPQSSVDILCACVIRGRDQMMTVSADWKLTRCSKVLLEKLTGPQLKKILSILWFRIVHYRIQMSSNLTLSCAQLIQCMPPSHFLNIRFSISSHPLLVLPSGLSPSGLPTQKLYAPVLWGIQVTCQPHHILVDLMIQFFFFHSPAVHLDMITYLFIKLNAKLDCSRSSGSVFHVVSVRI